VARVRTRITKRLLDSTPTPAKDVIIWDDALKGFFVKVTPQGKRVFGVYYRLPDGTQRRPMIGAYSPQMDVERARKRAAEMLVETNAGGDPSGARQQARLAISVADLCDRYMSEYAARRKRPSSLRTDEMIIRRNIKPAFGDRSAENITRADIANLHSKLGDAPIMANRTLALLSHIFNMAETWGLRPERSNPVLRIPRYPEVKRERFLSIEELQRLTGVLRAEEAAGSTPTRTLDAIWLLLLTGCRLSEILTLRWDEVDQTAGIIRKAMSKTGKMAVALNKPARARVDAIHERAPRDPQWVIPGDKLGNPLVNLEKPWRRIRGIAGLDDVRIHDLRHTYASLGVSAGISLPLIGALLNHKQPGTTARYAHAAPDPVRQAAEAIGQVFENM